MKSAAVVAPEGSRADTAPAPAPAPRTYPPCPPPGPARDKWVADLRARWPGNKGQRQQQPPSPPQHQPAADTAADDVEVDDDVDVEPADEAADPADHDGRIKSALDGLLAKSLERDPKTGRYLHGKVTTMADSEGFFKNLSAVKTDILAGVLAQLAVTEESAPPTLKAVAEIFVESHLLRRAAFMRLSSLGGPLTSKGKARSLIAAWGSFADREMKAAEKLGLVRISKAISATPREWLTEQVDQRQQQQSQQQQPSQSQPTAQPTDDTAAD